MSSQKAKKPKSPQLSRVKSAENFNFLEALQSDEVQSSLYNLITKAVGDLLHSLSSKVTELEKSNELLITTVTELENKCAEQQTVIMKNEVEHKKQRNNCVKWRVLYMI